MLCPSISNCHSLCWKIVYLIYVADPLGTLIQSICYPRTCAFLKSEYTLIDSAAISAEWLDHGKGLCVVGHLVLVYFWNLC